MRYRKWSTPISFAQMPAFFANDISGVFGRDCSSVLSNNWCMKQINTWQNTITSNFFCTYHVFYFLWIQHQFNKTVGGITWRETKKESSYKKRHGMLKSCSNTPSSRNNQLFEKWQQPLISIQVEVNIRFPIAGRTRAHPPSLILHNVSVVAGNTTWKHLGTRAVSCISEKKL